jgi:DNA invertase Pin-like site-specific DNA recombinase
VGNTQYAAGYVRMSTDLQDLSVAVQEKAIREYAELHALQLVATYRDEGRSGRSLKQREGMRHLLRDVADDHCPFSLILVYDVSRWGRFEDTDASAYYEYHCRLHGVDVVYVKELFTGDSSPLASLIKSLKRVMAAEYSRELAVKVRAGHDRAIALGFQMGTPPALGISRQAVGRDRARNLAPLERKALQSERIKWVRGPAEEVRLVRRIFSMYTESHVSVKEVARRLAREGAVGRNGQPLTP